MICMRIMPLPKDKYSKRNVLSRTGSILFSFRADRFVLKGGKISFDRMPFPDRVSIPLKATASKTFSHRSSLSFWSIVKQSTI